MVLLDEIDARAPHRSRRSDGTIGDAAHRANAWSDHNPRNGLVCALDITDDPPHFDPDDFAEVLIARRDLRVKYLISDGRVATSYPSSKGPAWTWRKYTGLNGHFAHLHISVLMDRANDTETWFPQQPKADDMANVSDEQLTTLIRAAEEVLQHAPRWSAASSKTIGPHDGALGEILRAARLQGPTLARILAALGETDDAVAELTQSIDAALASEGVTATGEQVEAALRRVFAEIGGS